MANEPLKPKRSRTEIQEGIRAAAVQEFVALCRRLSARD